LTGREWERLEEGWRVLNDYAAMPRFWEKHDRSIEDGRDVVAEGAAALNRLVGIKSGE
jgi:hypothetical protein